MRANLKGKGLFLTKKMLLLCCRAKAEENALLRVPDSSGYHCFEMSGSRALHQGKLVLHFPAGCYDSERIQELLSLFLGISNKVEYLTLLLFPSFPNSCYTNTRACAVVAERCLPSALPDSQSHTGARSWHSWGQSKFLVVSSVANTISFLCSNSIHLDHL